MKSTEKGASEKKVTTTKVKLGWYTLSLALLLPAHANASPLSDLAATVEPGTFVELEIDGPLTTCDVMVPPPEVDRNAFGNILEFTDEALWEPTAREIYIMGERRPYQADDKMFVRYSEETNSWEILERPPFNTGFHGYDHGAIDPVRRTYYRAMTGTARRVWRMDIETGVWLELPLAPAPGAGQIIAMDFFPEIDGLAYFSSYFDETSITNYVSYAPDDDAWERTVIDAPFGTQSAFSEYSAGHGVMYFGGGHHWSNGGTIPDPTPSIRESRRFYMLDADQVVTRLANAPAYLGQGGSGPVQTIDPISGNLVVFPGRGIDHEPGMPCEDPLPIYEYNHEEDLWRQTGTQGLTSRWCGMDTAAVPLYDYGVIFIVNVRSDTSCKVLLYRHAPGSGPGIVTEDPTVLTPSDAGLAEDAGMPEVTSHPNDAVSRADAGPVEGVGCQCGASSTTNPMSWFLAFALLVGINRAGRRRNQ